MLPIHGASISKSKSAMVRAMQNVDFLEPFFKGLVSVNEQRTAMRCLNKHEAPLGQWMKIL